VAKTVAVVQTPMAAGANVSGFAKLEDCPAGGGPAGVAHESMPGFSIIHDTYLFGGNL